MYKRQPEYVELIKAVMMQESGGRGLDPMQAAEGLSLIHIYCTMVIVGALALGMTTTAFAANDPLTVVNNLSDFIFGLIRAIGMRCV